MSNLTAGQEFKNAYPFIRDTYTAYDEEGEYQCKSWRPGVSMEAYGSPYGDEVDILAHGEGFQILTVVDVHKPGRYPTRVFYTRSWIDPDGKAFGKSRLRIATVEQFKRLAAGFRYAYDVEDQASEEAA